MPALSNVAKFAAPAPSWSSVAGRRDSTIISTATWGQAPNWILGLPSSVVVPSDATFPYIVASNVPAKINNPDGFAYTVSISGAHDAALFYDSANGNLVLNQPVGAVNNTIQLALSLGGRGANILSSSIAISFSPATVSWFTLPTLSCDRSLPFPQTLLANVRSGYLSDPGNQVDTVSLQAVNVTGLRYDAVSDSIIQDTDPGADGFDDVNMAATLKTATVTALQDFNTRVSNPNVIWAHNWDTAAEVDAFRLAGDQTNDPSSTYRPSQAVTVAWDTTDKLSGSGCMRITNPAGSAEGGNWGRPFNPLTGTGVGQNPAANGSIPKFAWAPVSGGLQTQRWTHGGFFGPPDLQSANPGWYIGQRFLLQLRVKMDPRCTHASIQEVGKLFWLSLTAGTSNASQIVTHSKGTDNQNGTTGALNYHNMYGAYDGGSGYAPIGPNDHAGQTGSELGTPYCDYRAGSGTHNTTHCWAYSGGWDTLLYDVIVGHDNGNDTTMKVYAAHEGEHTYTMIWNVTFNKGYQQPDASNGGTNQYGSLYVRPGINCFEPGFYVNKFEYTYSTTTDAWHKYGEAILAKAPDLVTDARLILPCPQFP